MSNSKLISYTKISPNCNSPRNHTIDTVTIHCVVGQLSVETMGNMFAQSSYQASCNYCIGSDGRIGLIVSEGDRSWCTSSRENDNRAVTIECASDKTDPYAVNDKVYASLINLLTDICQRNGIKKLVWSTSKDERVNHRNGCNMTVHRDYANKACPGEYLYSRHGQIAAEVNERLGSGSEPSSPDIRDVQIGDSTVNEISKVVYNEAGVIKKYDALVAVAQCIKDMTDNGGYGKGITDVMERNFYAYGQSATTDESRQAVYDVFVNGKRRFQDAVILQFRSFTNYSDGKGNMDTTKCASLLAKYEYLGKDARDNRWGHFYFGHKVATADPAPEVTQPAQPATTTTAKVTDKVIAACKVFQKQLKADIKDGKQWTYHNPSKYLCEQWSKALKKGKRACNCALLARWALKEAGLIPQDTGIFYGKSDGTISWSAATKKAVKKNCDVIHVGNKTVSQLIKDGTLQPGDIVTYASLQHTNIYAGGNKWYDAGHAYCNGSGEGAVFKSWHGKTMYGSYKVAYIIREKGKTAATKSTYIVQAGSFSKKANATKRMNEVKAAGFDAFVKQGDDGEYKVQCGSFEDKTNADALVVKLKATGFEAIIKTV